MNPVLALIVTNIIWGGAIPISKLGLTNIPPFIFLFTRFFLAAILFLPALRNYKKELFTPHRWAVIILASFLGFTSQIGILYVALPQTQSINAAIILSSSPIVLFLLSILVLHEKVRVRPTIGTIVSTLGVLTIIFSPFLLKGAKPSLGAVQSNILFVIATVSFVFSTLLFKKITEKINPFLVTFLAFTFASISFLPPAIHELQSWSFSQLAFPGILGLVYGTLFSSAAAYYLYFYGLSKIRGQEVGIFSYIDPVASVLIAMPLLHEFPSHYFILGTVLVFGGIFISEGRLHYHPFHKVK